MKHNRKFLLAALALILVAVFCWSGAMAVPLSEIKFAASYPAETWKPTYSYIGQQCMSYYISLDSYTGDELYLGWSSSDSSVAEVERGKTSGTTGVYLRVYKPGKVTITAQALDAYGKEIAGVTDSAELEFVLKKETSVTFDDTKIDVVKGDNENLRSMVTVEPYDASYDEYDLTWTTSDSTVAIVTNEGRVYGMKVGTATITATAKGDPTISGSITVNVKESVLTSLKFSEAALVLPKGTRNFPMYAMVEADGAGAVVYTSSDSNVVYIDNDGYADAKKAGTATITVSAVMNPAIYAECVVTVSEKPVTGISFSQEEFTIYAGDEDREIGQYLLEPADGSFDRITFATSNPEVAKVGWNEYYQRIYASGYAVGTATITASVRVNETTIVTGTFKVNVKEFAITSMAFSKAEYPLNLNKRTEIELGGKRLIIKPDDYSALKDPDAINGLIIWESSDDTIATVDADGKVTAHAPGKATITAKYSKDPSIFAKADVVIGTTPVKTLALSKKELTLSEKMYYNQTFYAQIEPADAYVKEIYYEVEDPEIASLSCDTYLNQPGASSLKIAEFTVYGGKAGTTNVKIFVDDGTKVHEAVLKLTVVKKEVNLQIALEGDDDTPITSVTAPLRKKAALNKGAVDLKAIVVDELTQKKIKSFSDPDVVWTTSDKKIATVDRNGRVTVKKAGKVKITATVTDGTNKSASVTVKITKNLIKKITGNKKITMRVGQKDLLLNYLKLVAKNTNIALYDETLTYKSANENIVSVNDEGVICANQAGEVKITIKAADGSKKQFVITVKVVAEQQ